MASAENCGKCRGHCKVKLNYAFGESCHSFFRTCGKSYDCYPHLCSDMPFHRPLTSLIRSESFLMYLIFIISDPTDFLSLTCEQEMIPFAVVGSDQEYQVNGRRLLGRKTKWGTIEGTTLTPSFIPLKCFPFFVRLFKFISRDTSRTESVSIPITNWKFFLLRRKDNGDLTESFSQ